MVKPYGGRIPSPMKLPIEDLTPKQIVAELDRYIIGQEQAKRSVAIALRNRFRRQKLTPEQRDEIVPKNILMIGPTGVGKTEIARRLAHLARAPFVKVEATKFTEVGYVGRDVDSMVRDLVNVSIRLVENEKTEGVKEEAYERAIDKIVEQLVDPYYQIKEEDSDYSIATTLFEDTSRTTEANIYSKEKAEERAREKEAWERRRKKVREQIQSGARDSELIDIDVEEAQTPFLQVFSPQGLEEMGLDLTNPLGGAFGKNKTTKRVSIGEAKKILSEQEARKMIDQASVTKEALERAEQTGIIFLDELDKIAGREGGSGPDVSREGVQRDLLPIIEGSTVVTKYGPVRTDHILFVCAGAFHISKPSDLIPELQGRLPIRVELQALQESDLRKILKEPENALTLQYRYLLSAEGIDLTFTDDAIDEIASMAHQVNTRAENIGARRLHTVMEKLLEDYLFEAPDIEKKQIIIDKEIVREKLKNLVEDIDLSRYIL